MVGHLTGEQDPEYLLWRPVTRQAERGKPNGRAAKQLFDRHSVRGVVVQRQFIAGLLAGQTLLDFREGMKRVTGQLARPRLEIAKDDFIARHRCWFDLGPTAFNRASCEQVRLGEGDLNPLAETSGNKTAMGIDSSMRPGAPVGGTPGGGHG